MLGCKYRGYTSTKIRKDELIDTCWDVNMSWEMQSIYKNNELIDTCWDVNEALYIFNLISEKN